MSCGQKRNGHIGPYGGAAAPRRRAQTTACRRRCNLKPRPPAPRPAPLRTTQYPNLNSTRAVPTPQPRTQCQLEAPSGCSCQAAILAQSLRVGDSDSSDSEPDSETQARSRRLRAPSPSGVTEWPGSLARGSLPVSVSRSCTQGKSYTGRGKTQLAHPSLAHRRSHTLAHAPFSFIAPFFRSGCKQNSQLVAPASDHRSRVRLLIRCHPFFKALHVPRCIDSTIHNR